MHVHTHKRSRRYIVDRNNRSALTHFKDLTLCHFSLFDNKLRNMNELTVTKQHQGSSDHVMKRNSVAHIAVMK